MVVRNQTKDAVWTDDRPVCPSFTPTRVDQVCSTEVKECIIGFFVRWQCGEFNERRGNGRHQPNECLSLDIRQASVAAYLQARVDLVCIFHRNTLLRRAIEQRPHESQQCSGNVRHHPSKAAKWIDPCGKTGRHKSSTRLASANRSPHRQNGANVQACTHLSSA